MRFSYREILAVVAVGTLITVAQSPGPNLSWAQQKPRALATSPKPDWRGADLANTGQIAVAGPAITPTQTFNVNPASVSIMQGIELDAAGNVIFSSNNGNQ